MITQKRMRNQITKFRIAYVYSDADSILDSIAEIFESIKELVESGKIVKLTTATETHFVYKIQKLDGSLLFYQDGNETVKAMDLMHITGAEAYDAVKENIQPEKY